MARSPARPSPAPSSPFVQHVIRWGMALVAGAIMLASCDEGTPTGAGEDYALSLAPAALTIEQGQNGSAAVTLTRTNFTGTVTLSLTGAPAGVTGVFDPATPSGATATLTVSVGAAVAPGVYDLTVAGTATAGNRSTPLTLTVSATPDYALSLTPTALTINQSANGNTAVTITRTNFTGAVALSLGGAPAGVTGVFAPAAPTGGTSTLTVTVGAAVAPGVYNLTVDGTGTPGNRSTPLTLNVGAAPDYALSLSPAALTIVQAGNGNTAVTLTRTNFTGAVTLSLGGAPAGVTGSFNPAGPTGTSSTLSVTVGAAVAAGVYNLTVDGTGTAGNRSTPLALTVTAAAADYALSLLPAALPIAPGANANTTVTITRTNFAGAVTLSLGNAPAGVTGSFNPAAPTGTSSTLTVTVGAAVAPGVYNLTVDGTGAPGNRSTPLTLTVSATPDYALSLAPAALTIVQGGNGNSSVTLTRSNFTGAVTLSLGGAPAGVTGVFAPAAPTGTSSTLTVTVGAAVAAGVYNLTVDGTGTAGNRSTPLTLTVSAAPDYALSLTPAALTIAQNANGNTAVTITRTNFTGAVTLSLGGAPAGVTGVFAPAAPTGTSATLTVTVGAAVAAGVYNLTVDGTGTPGNRSTPLTLTVSAAPDYALSLTPAALTIAQSANANTAVTITRTNFTGAVTLSLTGAPAGVTGAFNPAAPTGTSSTLTVTVGAAVVPGVYNLTVEGTGTAGNRSTPLTLTVSATPDYALSLAPAALTIAQNSGGPVVNVTITRTNFTGAVTLSLGNAPAGVTGAFIPAAPTGTSSALSVTVGAAVATGVYNLTVDGTGTPGNRSTPLTLTVTSSGGGGSVTVSFAACPVADRPVWLASKDGVGAWVPVTGVADVYNFDIVSGTGGIAYVVLGAGNVSDIQVLYRTQAEWTAGPLEICPATPTTRSFTGTAAGLAITESGQLSLGGGSTIASFNALAFQIDGVSDGTHDLVGFRSDFATPGTERALLRRDIVVNGNGTLGTVDFAGSESFAPTTATITIGGLLGGETVTQSTFYQVGATCEAASLVPFANAAASFTAFGIPAGEQRLSDFHRVQITAFTATDIRLVGESFHTMAARTITLGAVLPAPIISTLGGPYKRLSAAFNLPGDYQSLTSFGYTDGANEKSVNIGASIGYLGGSSVSLGLDDFSALAGWSNTWAPASASTGDWSVFGTGGNIGGSLCVENTNFKTVTKLGTF